MTPDSSLAAEVSASPNFDDRRGRSIDALILHYTGMATGEAARMRLRDPAAQVSCHYLVWEDGRIEQMVTEADRAWHAGRSYWAGETDLNAISIGIEIVNGGHDFGCPPYPDRQVASVIALCGDICDRHAIPAARVLGHSDVAPERKRDPGEWFPWERLAADGIGLWAETVSAQNDDGDRVIVIQPILAAIGYFCPTSGTADPATVAAVTAFQRHYRPAQVDGTVDDETLGLARRLLGRVGY